MALRVMALYAGGIRRMSFLDNLMPEEQDMLVSLPYRVGLWVSQSDSRGGEGSDEEERQALFNILNGFAEEVFGCETMQHIISATMTRRDEWSRWSINLESVVPDCRRAVDILSEAVDPKEVNGFKHHLMDIGEAVALAFREETESDFFQKIKTYALFFKGKLDASLEKRPYKSMEQFLNISLHERQALSRLAEALGTGYT
ncbi:MAG: hypothetical protein L0209_03480 [candidate division Zixibacteria bacterium]|nr:hypothetical protein [candidate division Zixibacteria bacterium]